MVFLSNLGACPRRLSPPALAAASSSSPSLRRLLTRSIIADLSHLLLQSTMGRFGGRQEGGGNEDWGLGSAARWRYRYSLLPDISAEAALRRAALPGRYRRAGVLVPEVDAALVEVVRRHLHRHAVTRKDTDAVLLHPSRRIGDHLVAIVELHAAARVGQDLVHDTLELQHLFLGHARSSFGRA